MLSLLLSPLGRALALAVTVLAGAYSLYAWGKAAGLQEAAAAMQRHALEARESRDATDRSVDRLPDGGAADQLVREWSRKPE